ncbi:AAA+ ATPase motif [Mollivirus sibericum]|uniref:AAA+ ATPase motif n=1 Tax=Mollivirus sibericum TaxID=1678078 RepID=UPI0006B2E6F9|nr:AAA+ ATPase motif [Mollivirus sibericum]ALD62227.1 AAA+ ATPase motif [Mollivirus sibericum]
MRSWRDRRREARINRCTPDPRHYELQKPRVDFASMGRAHFARSSSCSSTPQTNNINNSNNKDEVIDLTTEGQSVLYVSAARDNSIGSALSALVASKQKQPSAPTPTALPLVPQVVQPRKPQWLAEVVAVEREKSRKRLQEIAEFERALTSHAQAKSKSKERKNPVRPPARKKFKVDVPLPSRFLPAAIAIKPCDESLLAKIEKPWSPAPTLPLFYSQNYCLETMKAWLAKFSSNDPSAPVSLMLGGPVGCGKSMLVRIMAQRLGYTVTEVGTATLEYSALRNASEGVLESSIAAQIKMASNSMDLLAGSRNRSRTLVLVEDIDAIAELYEQCAFTGKSGKSPKSRELYDVTLVEPVLRLLDQARRAKTENVNPIVFTCSSSSSRHVRRLANLKAFCRRVMMFAPNINELGGVYAASLLAARTGASSSSPPQVSHKARRDDRNRGEYIAKSCNKDARRVRMQAMFDAQHVARGGSGDGLVVADTADGMSVDVYPRAKWALYGDTPQNCMKEPRTVSHIVGTVTNSSSVDVLTPLIRHNYMHVFGIAEECALNVAANNKANCLDQEGQGSIDETTSSWLMAQGPCVTFADISSIAAKASRKTYEACPMPVFAGATDASTSQLALLDSLSRCADLMADADLIAEGIATGKGGPTGSGGWRRSSNNNNNSGPGNDGFDLDLVPDMLVAAAVPVLGPPALALEEALRLKFTLPVDYPHINKETDDAVKNTRRLDMALSFAVGAGSNYDPLDRATCLRLIQNCDKSLESNKQHLDDLNRSLVYFEVTPNDLMHAKGRCDCRSCRRKQPCDFVAAYQEVYDRFSSETRRNLIRAPKDSPRTRTPVAAKAARKQHQQQPDSVSLDVLVGPAKGRDKSKNNEKRILYAIG